MYVTKSHINSAKEWKFGSASVGGGIRESPWVCIDTNIISSLLVEIDSMRIFISLTIPLETLGFVRD